ncbi:MAG TPA: zf-HC2 domain-containing protein [Cyclobacteriaceae bacterium]|nr:zf-HC2 domain-containing protein [Cyclobacteriaceae bacterium]
MKCEEVQSVLIDYIDGGLEAETRKEIDDHLKSCEVCSGELARERMIIDKMAGSETIIPGERLRANFHAMLKSEIENLARANSIKETPIHRILGIKWSSPFMRIAAGLAILIAGIAIGVFIRSGSGRQQSGQLSELKIEMQEMKEMLMLTMLNEESASQRIKAVNYTSEISVPDQKVITALISTLNHDKNVNVRMAAAYSLSKYWDNTLVRDSLVESLGRQNDPIIQIVLINIFTDKKEIKAIRPMQDIIMNENTISEVKDIAEKSLTILM